jgi:general secretion pathway protein A
MYERFYGLRQRPFELTADPKFLFMTPRHREALSNLQYGLATAKAVTVLIGDAGTGKTTLLRAALQSEVCRRVHTVCITNPALTRSEFVETLARGFGLSDGAAVSKATLLTELEQMLTRRRAAGETMALVVDEAQRMSDELLEEIRLLANIETAETKLLPLVLAGQTELSDRLNTTELRQLKQRVALRCEIGPFQLEETASYIASRIHGAGGRAAGLFTREAVMTIHSRAAGIPRTINVICDNALLSGFALGVTRVTNSMVVEVCRDFDLHERGATAAAVNPGDGAQTSADRVEGFTTVALAVEPSAPAAEPVIAPRPSAETDEQPGHVRKLRRFSFFGR